MASCNSNSSQIDYFELKKSVYQGTELLNELLRFEVTHSSHFESKVDLGSYYLMLGAYQTAEYYLLRAESVIDNAGKSPESRASKSVLWGSLATLRLMGNDLSAALKYADKAISADQKTGKNYRLLKAQILYSQGNADGALSLFDGCWTKDRDLFKPEDLLLYAKLLFGAQRTEESVAAVNAFISTGNYSYGDGMFASSVYEKAGERGKAVEYAFLDFLILRCGDPTNDGAFLRQLDAVDAKFSEEEDYAAVRDSLNLVRSYIDITIPYDAVASGDTPVGRFIKLANGIRDSRASADMVSDFLALEPLFKGFSEYYVLAWKGLSAVAPEQESVLRRTLEKAIVIGSGRPDAKFARSRLGISIGLSDTESLSLVIPAELEVIARRYAQNRDPADFARIIAVLGLPDNSYVYDNVIWLNQYGQSLGLAPVLSQYADSHNDKAAERIRFIQERN